MLLLELIDKLEEKLRLFVASVEVASRWKIADDDIWLENFDAVIKQFHEKDYHLLVNSYKLT